jgi:hypothetical protein
MTAKALAKTSALHSRVRERGAVALEDVYMSMIGYSGD